MREMRVPQTFGRQYHLENGRDECILRLSACTPCTSVSAPVTCQCSTRVFILEIYGFNSAKSFRAEVRSHSGRRRQRTCQISLTLRVEPHAANHSAKQRSTPSGPHKVVRTRFARHHCTSAAQLHVHARHLRPLAPPWRRHELGVVARQHPRQALDQERQRSQVGQRAAWLVARLGVTGLFTLYKRVSL